jgi:hypothetical protein
VWLTGCGVGDSQEGSHWPLNRVGLVIVGFNDGGIKAPLSSIKDGTGRQAASCRPGATSNTITTPSLNFTNHHCSSDKLQTLNAASKWMHSISTLVSQWNGIPLVSCRLVCTEFPPTSGRKKKRSPGDMLPRK